MLYQIISGRYEAGTPDQQQSYAQLFGSENIQFHFDLYFHWYNLIHELGHCLVSSRKISMDPVQEELYVNRFAVAYWQVADDSGNLRKLKDMVVKILDQIPSPVPPDMDFAAYFQSIWNSETMQTVAMYGYFQLACVVEAMKAGNGLGEVLREIGISAVQLDSIRKYSGDVSAARAQDVIDLCLNNLSDAGVVLDDCQVQLELVDNPEVQCARIMGQ